MKFRKIAAFSIAAALAVSVAWGDKVVFLHTNDTHSSIDPVLPVGGILQRKAIVDSVRKADKNVLLIDAGDAVQGTLYFKFFGGDVEYPLMNMMDYDIRILGNHEFDNGLKQLADHYKDVKADRLSANYDFSNTPLKGMFRPYVIKKIGGKKIGFIGININPESLMSKQNYDGLVYKDLIKTANETARMLKHDKKCDAVIVVSHIGVSKSSGEPTDYDLAVSSHDIDAIIGGHSHTTILPGNKGDYPDVVKNADGRDVLVVQTGKYGRNIGEIDIDTDKLGKGIDAFRYKLIPVTDRFPEAQLDKRMMKFLAPYKHVVDSVNAHVIGRSLETLDNSDRNGGYANFGADYARWYGQLVADSLGDGRRVDIGFLNVGGIRQKMPKGDITEGEILSTFPFSNRMVLMDIKGRDFIEAMKVAAAKGGEAVSENIRVVTDGKGNLVRVVIDDKEMDPEKTYVMSTIDFVAQGKDKLVTMANGKVFWRDSVEMCAPVLRYIRTLTDLGLPVDPDMNGRFVKEVKISK